MAAFGPDPIPQSALSGKQVALIVYILYFVAYFTGITALIGVIIAHLQVGSGFAVLLWWFIWSLVRNIKGVLALNENQPIANPASWLFG